MKIVIKTSLMLFLILLGFFLGSSSFFKEDKLHVISLIPPEKADNWTVEFCGENYEILKQVFSSAFQCEVNLIISRNDQRVDEMYLTAGAEYYILIDSTNLKNEITIKVL